MKGLFIFSARWRLSKRDPELIYKLKIRNVFRSKGNFYLMKHCSFWVFYTNSTFDSNHKARNFLKMLKMKGHFNTFYTTLLGTFWSNFLGYLSL